MPRRSAAADKPTYLLTCMACAEDHATHKPKAKRCQSCIDSDIPARTSTCPACDQRFPRIDSETFCRVCRELTPEARTEVSVRIAMQREPVSEEQRLKADEAIQRELEQEAEERRLRNEQKRRDRVRSQLDQLEALSKKPKGYPAMTKEAAETPIGLLWANLCDTEGATGVLLKDKTVDDQTKAAMLTTYLNLRLKGFTSAAVAKVDPAKLMAQDMAEVDAAIRELPQVEAADDDDDDDLAFDPFEDLDPEMKAEVIEFQQQQQDRRLAEQLGLSA